jgi:hypothetical protein
MLLTIAYAKDLDNVLNLVRAFFAWAIAKVGETSGQPALDSAFVSFCPARRRLPYRRDLPQPHGCKGRLK